MAEFDPTPSPPEPGLPTYWIDDPNGPPNMARPIPNDPLNGFTAGKAGGLTGSLQIGRTTPISDAVATAGRPLFPSSQS